MSLKMLIYMDYFYASTQPFLTLCHGEVVLALVVSILKIYIDLWCLIFVRVQVISSRDPFRMLTSIPLHKVVFLLYSYFPCIF